LVVEVESRCGFGDGRGEEHRAESVPASPVGKYEMRKVILRTEKMEEGEYKATGAVVIII
jgi:hypothetical protein